MVDTQKPVIELLPITEGLEPSWMRGYIEPGFTATDNVDGLADRIRDAGYTVFVSPRDVTIPSEPPFPIRMAFCIGPLGEEIELFMER